MTVATDSHTRAALHLLRSPLLRNKTTRWIDDDDLIDWPAILDAMPVWSSGERLLACLAAELFNRWLLDEHVTFGDLADTLDKENWRIVVEALQIRRGRP